ncbi:hypothetical protein [Salinispora arenicola]|uniref:Uncharacterized protein n=1 Tax=Salinispora arenicola TaxID=168697 RepID=A0A542XUT6_SALAC|nr:hypothetical protein [Salinispora arenicola]TQL39589.1 hypothetical protein FB564_4855 [Salinispora arenicola]GIM81470.1 hypothetical protein Sar04_02400 [Salinispora arenicola]
MTKDTLYLSSLDSVRFERVRECRFERSLAFDSGKTAVVAQLSPAVIGQDFNRNSDIDTVILVARHEGVSLDPVNEFPCFVFISIPHAEFDAIRTPIGRHEIDIIGWGELYRTREDAERHAFD